MKNEFGKYIPIAILALSCGDEPTSPVDRSNAIKEPTAAVTEVSSAESEEARNLSEYISNSVKYLNCAQKKVKGVSASKLQKDSKRDERGNASYESSSKCDDLEVRFAFSYECSPEDVASKRELSIVLQGDSKVAEYAVSYRPGSTLETKNFVISWGLSNDDLFPVKEFNYLANKVPAMEDPALGYEPIEHVYRVEEFTTDEEKIGDAIYKILQKVKFSGCVN